MHFIVTLSGCHFSCNEIVVLEVWCSPVIRQPFMNVLPPTCYQVKQALGTTCIASCESGFELSGPALVSCSFTRSAMWSPTDQPHCKGNYNDISFSIGILILFSKTKSAHIHQLL